MSSVGLMRQYAAALAVAAGSRTPPAIRKFVRFASRTCESLLLRRGRFLPGLKGGVSAAMLMKAELVIRHAG